MKKTILVIYALSAAHIQALEIKNDLLSELQKNHKEARQLIKANKEQEKKQEREERKNIVMTKNEAVALTVGITSLCIAVGCAGNYLIKDDPKTTETAILSVFVGIASGLAAYYKRDKDKQSRELARALDEIQVRTFLTWAGLI